MEPDEEIAARKAVVIESLSAVTLATRDMITAVRFYLALGFKLRYGGEDASFTSFHAGTSFLNLIVQRRGTEWSSWGRVILYVSDVDAAYGRVIELGLKPHAPPSNGPWGERYFHLTAPDGHELSFARPVSQPPPAD